MDLGFGDTNQVVGNAAAKVLLQTAKAQEEVIDAEMAQYDKLLDDDEALEQLRVRRLAQLKKAHEQRQTWKSNGHGVYSELGGTLDARDVGRDFFEASKRSERMVVHFYRPSTRLCDIFHAHLEKLAHKHLETRFVKINVEDCDKEGGGAAFLVERLRVVVMPTLVLIKDRQTVHQIQGFDELGGTDNFDTDSLARLIEVYGVLIQRKEEQDD